MAFDHERLRVYGRAVELVATVEALAKGLSPMHGAMADQIRRAASSVVLNIAEGASEYSRKEKMRFYRMARRSSAETRAGLDVLEAAGVVSKDQVRRVGAVAGDVGRMLSGQLRGNPAPAPAPGHAPAPAPAPAVPDHR